MTILNSWYEQVLLTLGQVTAGTWFVLACAALVVCLLLVVNAIVLWRRLRQQRLNMEQAGLEHREEATELRHAFELQKHDFDARIVHLNEQLGVARRRGETLEDRLQDAQAAYHSALNERDIAREQNRQLGPLKERIDKLSQQLDEQRTDASLAKTELSALNVQLTEERKAAAEKLKLLEHAKERLSAEFEVLANRIFEEKSEKLLNRNKQSLEHTLSPLKDQLSGFKKQVEDTYDKETRERLSLLHEVNALKDLNQKMSADAINLTRALKGDNKLQGNWGELILERVLEDSGLKKGREYQLQLNLSAEQQQRRLPDVIVHLPDQRDLVIDAKVSLLDYERYCSVDDEAEKQAALQAHIQSMRRHIKNLSIKDYAGLEGLRTLDFVFVFVPIEPAFLLAFEHDQGLFREAYDKNVIVVSPTTLLASLRTVQNLWRYDAQNKNAEKIARRAGGLHDQFVLVLESMEEMGRQIDRAKNSYATMMNRFSKGKGNLVNRTRELEKLGAKTKRQLPNTIKDLAETDVTDVRLSTESDNEVNEPEALEYAD